MGAIWSQQGSLRLNKEQWLIEREDLIEGKEYPFTKDKHRLYMIDIPMNLITRDRQAIAKVMITETTIGHNQTKGIYKVLKIFSDEEVRVVSGTIIPFDEISK